MSERTKGYWKIDKVATAGGAPIIVSDKCWLGGKRKIAKVLYHYGSEDPEVSPNAKFICLAVNYHDRLVEALNAISVKIVEQCNCCKPTSTSCISCHLIGIPSSIKTLLTEIEKER